MVVSPRRSARGGRHGFGEPRALRRRPGHREALFDADIVVPFDQGAPVVVLDRLRARARGLVRHVADRTHSGEFHVFARTALRAGGRSQGGEPDRSRGAADNGFRKYWPRNCNHLGRWRDFQKTFPGHLKTCIDDLLNLSLDDIRDASTTG